MTILNLPVHSTDALDHFRAKAEARQQAERQAKAELRRSEAQHRQRQQPAFDSAAWNDWFQRSFSNCMRPYEDALGKVLFDKFGPAILKVVDQKFEQRHGGPLPQIKQWEPEKVFYKGSLVSHDGSLWQSRADTAQCPSPDASQWALICQSERTAVTLEGCEKREDAWRAAVDQRIEAISEAIGTERHDRRDAVVKEISELRSALKTIREAIAAERGARRDEVVKAISELRSQLEAMIAAEREAQRDEIIRLREEISQLRAGTRAKLAAHEERMGTISGKLPIARAWRPETVTYQCAVVVHDGARWQAVRDTAQAPGGEDWLCVARGGRDGVDGASLNLRGPYDVHKRYERLDVVELATTPSSPGATARAFVRARIGCRSRCAAPEASKARGASPAPRATRARLALRSTRGKSIASAFAQVHSSRTAPWDRCWSCAGCSKSTKLKRVKRTAFTTSAM